MLKIGRNWRNWPEKEEASYYNPEAIETIYGPLREGHARGDYSVRLHIEGFFWTPRELMGTEGVSLAFYDMPEIVHRINQFALDVFMAHLSTVLDVLPADVVYIRRTSAGSTGH